MLDFILRRHRLAPKDLPICSRVCRSYSTPSSSDGESLHFKGEELVYQLSLPKNGWVLVKKMDRTSAVTACKRIPESSFLLLCSAICLIYKTSLKGNANPGIYSGVPEAYISKPQIGPYRATTTVGIPDGSLVIQPGDILQINGKYLSSFFRSKFHSTKLLELRIANGERHDFRHNTPRILDMRSAGQYW